MGTLSDKLRSTVFYGILDTGYVAKCDMFSKCEAIVKSGTKIIQLRAKAEDATERRKMAYEILPIFKKHSDIFFIINDDVDLAAEICREIPNAGLHVGQDDCDPNDARKAIGNDRVLGRSTHSKEQALTADSLADVLDYFAVGPVYSTNTKPGRIPVGLELVKTVSTLSPTLPWYAIGGVNLKTAANVRRAGADRIVAVSDVLIANDTTFAIRNLIDTFLTIDKD